MAEDRTTTNEDIVKELKLLRRDFKKYSSQETFKRRFLMSLVTGFGTVLGATLLVSLLVVVIRPFSNVKILEPIVKQVISIVENSKK